MVVREALEALAVRLRVVRASRAVPEARVGALEGLEVRGAALEVLVVPAVPEGAADLVRRLRR